MEGQTKESWHHQWEMTKRELSSEVQAPYWLLFFPVTFTDSLEFHFCCEKRIHSLSKRRCQIDTDRWFFRELLNPNDKFVTVKWFRNCERFDAICSVYVCTRAKIPGHFSSIKSRQICITTERSPVVGTPLIYQSLVLCGGKKTVIIDLLNWRLTIPLFACSKFGA